MSQTFSLQKSREELKRQGYDTWIVEKPWSPYTKRREDLFNFADLVGIRDDIQGVTAIQATGDDVASHVTKMLQGFTDGKGNAIPPNPHLRIWLKASNRFFLWGWSLRGAKGKRKMYRLREIEFRIKDGVVVAEENNRVKETVSDSNPGSGDSSVLDSPAPVADSLLRAFQNDGLVE